MAIGNQRTRSNSTSNTTLDPLVSPVTPEELAYYLGVEYSVNDESILSMHLLAACGWYIEMSSNELLSRQWVMKLDNYPTDGASFSGLSPIYADLKAWIDIPLTPVTSIESITGNGESEGYVSDLSNKPPRVFLNNFSSNIVINYTAGYATPDDIPKSVMLGITMMAAYLYEHRGACKLSDAANESGANSVWGHTMMVLSL